MFSCNLQGRYLRDLVLRIPPSVTNGYLLVDSKMISFFGIDDAKYTLSGFKLYASACIWYDVIEEVQFPCEFSLLVEITKLISETDKISIATGNKDHIYFEIQNKSGNRRMLLPSTYTEQGPMIPGQLFGEQTIISISSSEFDRVCMMHQYATTVSLCCNYGAMRFKVNGIDLNIQYQMINSSECTIACSLDLLNMFRKCRFDQNKIHETTFKKLIQKKIYDHSILNSLDVVGVIKRFAFDVINEYYLSRAYTDKSLVMTIGETRPVGVAFQTGIGMIQYFVVPEL
eukprot:39778_1